MDTMTRPHCGCGRLAAINYKKNNRTYYRKKCGQCIKRENIPTQESWEIAGYIKKLKCEKCGFKSKYTEQMGVVPELGNNTYKSVCLNCAIAVNKTGGWRGGDLTPDF